MDVFDHQNTVLILIEPQNIKGNLKNSNLCLTKVDTIIVTVLNQVRKMFKWDDSEWSQESTLMVFF